jgi:hypothetical protein
MNDLQKAMLELKINRTLTRLEAQHHASKPIWADMKPHHVLPYVYALIVSRQLGLGHLSSGEMLQKLPVLSIGLTAQETLYLFEHLVFSYPTGFAENPWNNSNATLEHIRGLPTAVRWGGRTDPDETLTVFRGVSCYSEESAGQRLFRPLWSTWRLQALSCCITWLIDHPKTTPLLSEAKIKLRDVIAILNPSRYPQAVEVVADLRGLYDFRVDAPSEADLTLARNQLHRLAQPPSKNPGIRRDFLKIF